MEKIKNLLNENSVEIIWITNHYNKRYISGFSGTTSEVLISKEKIYFITDGRYESQIKNEIKDGIEIIIANSSVRYFEEVISILSKYNKIGIEAENLTVKIFNLLSKALPQNTTIKPLDNVVTNLRLCKSDEEIKKITEAVNITDKTFSDFIKVIKPGITEIEARNLADELHIKNGADKSSFDTILVSGINTALPHGVPSNKIIENGDIVTLDFGCYKNGYVSDMTRTFFVGTPENEKLIEIHNIVLQAHKKQIQAVKEGVSAFDIDKIGRTIIVDAGYGDYFVHGTGHGIGLEIHEGPYINKTDKVILKENMIITIEPGIYVPGLGGVRIEQDVIVKKDKGIELNKSPKHYLINQE